MRQKIMEVLLGFFAVLILLFIVFGLKNMDRKPPVISYPEDEELVYTEGEDKSALLIDVTAEDEKDGDVTASLVVESIYDFNDGTAKVVYVARDNASNMSKAERMIVLLEEGESVLAGSDEVGETEPVEDEDDVDSEDDENTDDPDATENTDNTSEDEPLVPDGEKPALRLSEKKVKIAVGGSFNPLNYVDEIVDDVNTRSELFRRIIIRGEYDVDTAGVYELEIYATDADGNATNREKLELTVEAANGQAEQ